MRFERLMAMRYLRVAQGREEGRGFLRFILYVAVGGVAVGVAALLLTLAIVRGFSSEIEEKIIGFGAHVQVRSSYQDVPLEDAGRIRDRLEQWAGVEHVTPVAEGFALLRRSRRDIDGMMLRGVEAPPAYLAGHVVEGQFSLAPDTAGHPGLVVGGALARRLDITVGDVVTAFAVPEGGEGSASLSAFARPRVKQFRVTGLYETSLENFDDLFAYAHLDIVRTLLDFRPGTATRLDVMLDEVDEAAAVAARVEESFDFPARAVTVYEAFSGLFAWVNLQESITPLVVGVIIIVAAFNIIGTLLMMMLEKTREVGVLLSIGASARSVRRLFLWLGLLIGAVGTLIGEGLALVLGLAQQRYELITLPAEAYYMSTAPVELNVLDFVMVGVVALALCAAAAYVPARVASRIEPVRALRFQ